MRKHHTREEKRSLGRKTSGFEVLSEKERFWEVKKQVLLREIEEK